MLLQRIGFFTLGVALPVSSMLSRRAAVVLVPIGVALLIIAALLTEPERFVRSFRRRCLRATTLALGLLIGWCLLSLGWAPKGGADRILNMLFALALGIAAIAALPERMRAANLNALAVGAGSAIAILIAMEMTGFGLGDRDDDLTLVIRGLALIITVSGPLVSWLLLRGRTRGGLALFGLLAAVTLVDAEPVLVVAMAAGTLAFAAVLAMRGRSVEWLALLLALIVMATPITPWIMLGAVQPVLHLDDQTLAPFSAWAALIAQAPIKLVTGHGFGASALSPQLPGSLLVEVWHDLGMVGATAIALSLWFAVSGLKVLQPVIRAGAAYAYVVAFTFGALGLAGFRAWWLMTMVAAVIVTTAVARGQARTDRPVATFVRARAPDGTSAPPAKPDNTP
ncbi:MAG: hypothetical protein NT037_02770 [Hyphomicrobiales bacterium]|nr:hypothetical protein [Hyphomicrobiales bacterium]